MKQIKIFADHIEPDALEQFHSAMNQEFAVKGALMPDAHSGYSLPIGAVVATDGMVLPAWVGYDIGCGMCAVRTTLLKHEILPHRAKIFDGMYRVIPTGFHHNKRPAAWDYQQYPMTPMLKKLFDKNGMSQLGSLGSGNHFIEICHDEENHVWVVIHSGSRNLGHSTATHYMKLASKSGKAREGHFGFRVDSEQGQDYITDMRFCLEFALQNRQEMINRALREIYHLAREGEKPQRLAFINRTHNHAEEKDGLWIHRKGATHAEKGMEGVIPGNMRDGSFIVVGKGNEESLNSSSHGAGRAMSRTRAKNAINMDKFKIQMKGITSKVGRSTLDEAPDAYKDIFDVMKLQKDLVDVTHHLLPIINVKA
ncbi:MAG: RtcB family protein [Nitrospinota bacterium]|nr:RtcB family protein [Nitrospinota bacterium]MDH5677164.1 RtcB family protein [Nitrospinota bacterium]MDH5757153.1 RtcB family protein [Nitrospinota bacterium]